MGCWFCSMESKKSIKSGAGPLGSCRCAGATALGSGKSLLGTCFCTPGVGFTGVLGTGFPPFLASCWTRYCRLLISKSGSFRYSSSELVRLVGACLSLGISRRVAFSCCLATLRNWTTWSVCLLNVLYILRARSASYFDISK